MDVTRSTLQARGTWGDMAEEVLKPYPDADRAKLLVSLIASYLVDFRHGNKREERAACEFLNEVVSIASRLQKEKECEVKP